MNTAQIVFTIFEIAILLSLIFFRAVSLTPSQMTDYELGRRARKKDAQAKSEQLKKQHLQDLLSLKFLIEAVLIVVLISYTVLNLGWFQGGLLSIVLFIFSSVAARWQFIEKFSNSLVDKYQEKIFTFVATSHWLLRFLRVPSPFVVGDFSPHSKQELLHIIRQSKDVLTNDEISILTHSVTLQEKTVKEIMTPKSAVQSIDKKELLGPLVLDDLHKAGHSRIPVINRNLDHVVGMLYIQDLLSLDNKHSVTVEKAMDKRVFYVHQDQTLEHALAAFLRVKHHLFIVINESRETIGVLSLEDIIEAILGKSIQDEFDQDSDASAVVARATQNNQPEKGVDV